MFLIMCMYMEDNRWKIILPFVDNNDCYQLLLSSFSVCSHATLIGAGGVAYCYKTASVLLLSELYVIMSHIKQKKKWYNSTTTSKISSYINYMF